MKMLLRFALATALVTTAAAPAAAGELRLSMANGLVTLIAKDVTVREILAEWARVGQAKIVNAEKLTGGPVTLELTDVPEARALDAVLRSAAGYVMAPRMAGSSGPSLYDRILILATSRAPAVTASTPAPFTNRAMQQMPQNNVNPADDDAEFGPGSPGVPGPVNQQQTPQAVNPGQFANPGQLQQNAQPQGPLTAPRPGMLPAPANVRAAAVAEPVSRHAARADGADVQPESPAAANHAAPGGPGGGPGGI